MKVFKINFEPLRTLSNGTGLLLEKSSLLKMGKIFNVMRPYF
jgi:hypothetical protein